MNPWLEIPLIVTLCCIALWSVFATLIWGITFLLDLFQR
jgi:hypothetical protein